MHRTSSKKWSLRCLMVWTHLLKEAGKARRLRWQTRLHPCWINLHACHQIVMVSTKCEGSTPRSIYLSSSSSSCVVSIAESLEFLISKTIVRSKTTYPIWVPDLFLGFVLFPIGRGEGLPAGAKGSSTSERISTDIFFLLTTLLACPLRFARSCLLLSTNIVAIILSRGDRL